MRIRWRGLELPSRVVVNNAESYIACCRAGLGLMQIPRYDVQHLLDAGELVDRGIQLLNGNGEPGNIRKSLVNDGRDLHREGFEQCSRFLHFFPQDLVETDIIHRFPDTGDRTITRDNFNRKIHFKFITRLLFFGVIAVECVET